MKTSSLPALVLTCASLVLPCSAQVNSGSNGSDGAFNPTANITINMADHPDGIYHYTSVNIPVGVFVAFSPNANNTPVVWLVQTSCVISGIINLVAQPPNGATGGAGGPGGFGGGNGQFDKNHPPSSGMGPGAGIVPTVPDSTFYGANASYGTNGNRYTGEQYYWGDTYGNDFLIPLIGGSGGSGSGHFGINHGGGCGGGGAILIAASSTITINSGGSINAAGYDGGVAEGPYGGAGSGGAVRLVASTISGSGSINCAGLNLNNSTSGDGRVRLDALANTFGGTIYGVETRGYQPIIIPALAQQTQLAISSIAGIAVPANSTGTLLNPAVIIPGQQANPIPVVVQCSNIPLNTSISVQVNPTVGATVSAVGMNNVGTQTSSTATIPVNMPRGGGVILATAVTSITFASNDRGKKFRSLAETGWTADGEKFAKMELTVTPGGRQQIVYLTESGKRYPL